MITSAYYCDSQIQNVTQQWVLFICQVPLVSQIYKIMLSKPTKYVYVMHHRNLLYPIMAIIYDQHLRSLLSFPHPLSPFISRETEKPTKNVLVQCSLFIIAQKTKR